MLADSHIHTCLSYDSLADMKDSIVAGKKAGLSYMTFTEHLDIDPAKQLLADPSATYFELDIPKYQSQLQRYQQEETLPRLLFGIEIGLQPHLAATHQKIVNTYPFDYILGSSHTIEGFDPYYPDYFLDKSPKEAILCYFESIQKNLDAFSQIHAYAHLDYIVRYLPALSSKEDADKAKFLAKYYQPSQFQDSICHILDTLIKKEIALEVNTQSLRRHLGICNPHPQILTWYYQMGGRLITIGSDAHFSKDVGANIQDALASLSPIGFKEYFVFIKGSPLQLPIPSC